MGVQTRSVVTIRECQQVKPETLNLNVAPAEAALPFGHHDQVVRPVEQPTDGLFVARV
jgi:hypothetical protein